MASRATLLLVLLTSNPPGIQGQSIFCLFRNDFTLWSQYILPMLLLLISAGVILPLFLLQFLIDPDQYRVRTSKLEAVDSSGAERLIQNMFYSLGRKLGYCMPREEWCFKKTHLPVTCRMTKKGRHGEQEYHFRKSDISYATSTVLGPSGREINETDSVPVFMELKFQLG